MKKSIVSILALFMGAVGGVLGTKNVIEPKLNEARMISDKHLQLFLMMNQWVKIKQLGKCLETYFERNKYNKIAIYGMSYAGETLLEELHGTDIQVVYGIDKNAENIYANIDIYTPDDDLPGVDAIVVTAITFYEDIEEKLCKKVGAPILSLQNILNEI